MVKDPNAVAKLSVSPKAVEKKVETKEEVVELKGLIEQIYDRTHI